LHPGKGPAIRLSDAIAYIILPGAMHIIWLGFRRNGLTVACTVFFVCGIFFGGLVCAGRVCEITEIPGHTKTPDAQRRINDRIG